MATKLWVQLEKFLAGRNLSHAPWIPQDCRRLSELASPMAIHALEMWDALNKQGQLAHIISPLAPLGDFPWLILGEHLSFFRFWSADGDKMWQIYTRSGFIATGYSENTIWIFCYG